MRLNNLSYLIESGQNLALVLALAGVVLWLVVYGEAVRIGFREKTYAIPMVSISLNLVWEVYFGLICPASPDCPDGLSCLCPSSQGFQLWILRGWVVLDAVIFYQLLRYGRYKQTLPEVRRFFYLFVGLSLLLAFLGEAAFIETFKDTDGVFSTWTIAFVLAALFVYWAVNKVEGQSRLVGWTMLLGNGTYALSMFISNSAGFSYVRFLLIATVFLNVLYVVLLYRHKLGLARASS